MAKNRKMVDKEIEEVRQNQNLINRTIFEKLRVFCAHIVQKTELLSDDFLRENLKKQRFDKKTEETKDEKKHLDFFISFIRE